MSRTISLVSNLLRSSKTSLSFSNIALRHYSGSSLPLKVPITLSNGIAYNQPTGLFINNEFVPSTSGKTFKVESPATESEITHVYEAGAEDVEKAVSSAEKAYETWSVAEPSYRGDLLLKLADKIETNADLLASIESTDNGKALALARGDVALVAKVIRYYGGWADKIYGTSIDTNDGFFTYTRREPLGVCGQIIPWNFPLLMWSWKISPALATGNTIVLKTAESTPLSALVASELAKDVGIPAGVINVLSGYGATGAHIAQHMRIKKVAFTGSTATGRKIMEMAAASNLKKVTLELGGKSPHIIFDDADLETAVDVASLGIFYNSGEVCSAGSRLYVQEDVYDEVIERLKAKAESISVGDPFDLNTFQGAQTSKQQLDKILGYIKIGKDEGARVVTGGQRVDRPGYFVAPTIFADVNENMRIVKEEIFGPVITATKFKTVDEVVKLANNTEYGLGAGLHTNDVNKAIDVANKIHSGSVWVNTYNAFHEAVPFGGFNQSGMGREMGQQGLDNYTQVKAVRIKVDPKH